MELGQQPGRGGRVMSQTKRALPPARGRSALGKLDALLSVFAALALVLAVAVPADAQSGGEGEAIYRERCATCHENGATRAPGLATLRQMSPDRVLAALRSGSMSAQGQDLSTA